MHTLWLLAQFTFTSDIALFGLGILGIGVNAVIAFGAGKRGAGVYEERLNSHGIRLDGLDADKLRQWEKLGEHGNDIAYIKGKIE